MPWYYVLLPICPSADPWFPIDNLGNSSSFMCVSLVLEMLRLGLDKGNLSIISDEALAREVF